MLTELVYRGSAGEVQTYRVDAVEVVLGSADGSDIRLPVEGVSRRHAKIRKEGEDFVIEDLKSGSGTFLNGQQIQPEEKLLHLDVVALGKTAELIFIQRPEASDAAPEPAIGIESVRLESLMDPARYEIHPGELTLGRSPACNIVLESTAISQFHARIDRTREDVILRDLGSKNGTYLNDERVGVAFLEDGDQISLARAETFRIRIMKAQLARSAPVLRGEYPAAPRSRSSREVSFATGATAHGGQSLLSRGDVQVFPQEWKTRLLSGDVQFDEVGPSPTEGGEAE